MIDLPVAGKTGVSRSRQVRALSTRPNSAVVPPQHLHFDVTAQPLVHRGGVEHARPSATPLCLRPPPPPRPPRPAANTRRPTPAARAACMSVAQSPSMADRPRSNPWASAAPRIMPGPGLRRGLSRRQRPWPRRVVGAELRAGEGHIVGREARRNPVRQPVEIRLGAEVAPNAGLVDHHQRETPGRCDTTQHEDAIAEHQPVRRMHIAPAPVGDAVAALEPPRPHQPPRLAQRGGSACAATKAAGVPMSMNGASVGAARRSSPLPARPSVPSGAVSVAIAVSLPGVAPGPPRDV